MKKSINLEKFASIEENLRQSRKILVNWRKFFCFDKNRRQLREIELSYNF